MSYQRGFLLSEYSSSFTNTLIPFSSLIVLISELLTQIRMKLSSWEKYDRLVVMTLGMNFIYWRVSVIGKVPTTKKWMNKNITIIGWRMEIKIFRSRAVWSTRCVPGWIFVFFFRVYSKLFRSLCHPFGDRFWGWSMWLCF